MAERKKQYKVDFPLIGETTVAEWTYSCCPPVNVVSIPLILSGGLDIEVDAEAIKDAADLFGDLLGDKKIEKFIKKAKRLVPQGKMGVQCSLDVEKHEPKCPGNSGCFSAVGFTLRFTMIGNVSGTYGIVQGKAYAALSITIAHDIVLCDCPGATSGVSHETPEDEESETSDDALLRENYGVLISHVIPRDVARSLELGEQPHVGIAGMPQPGPAGGVGNGTRPAEIRYVDVFSEEPATGLRRLVQRIPVV